ncbi:MAG TPA: hypothetical protein VGI03_11700 [Verrucomicrobiae bacterium]
MNRHQAVLAKIREWKKDPKLPRALAAQLLGVSRPVFYSKLLAGLVQREHLDGQEYIRLSALENYCRGTISRRLSANKLRKPVGQRTLQNKTV